MTLANVSEAFYTSKMEALALLKKLKPARMKQFATTEEAIKFSASQELISDPPMVGYNNVSICNVAISQKPPFENY